jgi:CheY-like chemotaxis protein
LLRGSGYVVEEAVTGRQALDHLRLHRDRVALIIFDLLTPLLDGWQVREEQLADSCLSLIPVVVLTRAPRDRALDYVLQANDYLRSPVNDGALLDLVAQYCAAAV